MTDIQAVMTGFLSAVMVGITFYAEYASRRDRAEHNAYWDGYEAAMSDSEAANKVCCGG